MKEPTVWRPINETTSPTKASSERYSRQSDSLRGASGLSSRSVRSTDAK
jgi:hypothetical protein